MKGTRHSYKIRTALSSPYQVSYLTYGDPHASHQIFCCHGLTRNAMDFDPLSKYVCSNYTQTHVTSIDLCGRGMSDFVANNSLYTLSHACIECDDVINHVRATATATATSLKSKSKRTWIGTSYGGLLGMYYAAFYYPSIHHLILNDVGPYIPKQYISRLKEVSHNICTNTLNEMELKLKERYCQHYGPKMTDMDWMRMAQDGTYFDDVTNEYKLAYDPNVVDGLLMDFESKEDGTYDDWDIFEDVWKKIPAHVKILLIRGENSAVITRETVDKMIATNANLSVVEVEDVGHHPQLTDVAEMDIIAQFIGL